MRWIFHPSIFIPLEPIYSDFNFFFPIFFLAVRYLAISFSEEVGNIETEYSLYNF